MPTDYGDIVDYHRQESAKYLLLSKAARARGEIGEAEYLAWQSGRKADAQALASRAGTGSVGVRSLTSRSSCGRVHRYNHASCDIQEKVFFSRVIEALIAETPIVVNDSKQSFHSLQQCLSAHSEP